MPLEPTVDTLEGLPEAIAAEYKEQEGGGYILDVVPKNGYALENLDGLKSALGKERALATELQSRVKAFGDLDPNDVQTKLTRLQELEAIDPNKEADKLLETKMKSVQEQMAAKHRKELEAKEAEISKTKNYLKRIHIDDAAKSAIIKAGGDERTMTYMLPHIVNQLTIQETENGFITQVRDEFGNPRIGDSSGSAMTVEQLVLDMKSQSTWEPAFPGAGKSGGGTPPNTQGGKPQSSQKKDLSSMSAKEKSQFIAENPDNWMELIAKQSQS